MTSRNSKTGPRVLDQIRLSVVTCTRQRASVLESRSMASVLAQSCPDFEWVLVNDGGDLTTRRLVEKLDDSLSISYVEMPHPATGFGLCYARNLGLLEARGPWVVYLDDDHQIGPDFVGDLLARIESDPGLRFGVTGQLRRDSGGRDQHWPAAEINALDLIRSAQPGSRLGFDANGFFHLRSRSPRWNPEYRLYRDVEYLLQCVDRWGEGAFRSFDPPTLRMNVPEPGASSALTAQQKTEEWGRFWERRSRYPTLLAHPELLQGS